MTVYSDDFLFVVYWFLEVPVGELEPCGSSALRNGSWVLPSVSQVPNDTLFDTKVPHGATKRLKSMRTLHAGARAA